MICLACGKTVSLEANDDSVCSDPRNPSPPDTAGNRHHIFVYENNREHAKAAVDRIRAARTVTCTQSESTRTPIESRREGIAVSERKKLGRAIKQIRQIVSEFKKMDSPDRKYLLNLIESADPEIFHVVARENGHERR